MVSYGDWRQDPDIALEADSTDPSRPTSTLSATGAYGGAAEQVVAQEGGYYVITSGDLSTVVGGAMEASGPDSGPSGAPYGLSYYWGYDFVVIPPTYYSRWGAAHYSWYWDVRPQPEGYDYTPGWYGITDPDAIGVEFEGTTFDPANPFPSAPAPVVGMKLASSTLIGARVGDDSSPDGEVPGSWASDIKIAFGGGDAVTLVSRGDGGLRTTSASLHLEPLGFDVSLDFLAEHGWECSLYALTPDFLIPTDLPVPGDSSYSANGSMSYGWSIHQPAIVWTIRPPRYRFVYSDDVATYRRVFPRDDGLAGGAPRTWPPSKAAQSSNRTFGGYL